MTFSICKPKLLLLVSIAVLHLGLNTGFSQTGPLGSGDIYKLKVDKDGIYKIDKMFFEELGISIENLDPNSVSLFGFGYGMLPQKNSEGRPNVLLEVPLKFIGESNSSFSNSNYFLFYGEGPNKVLYDSINNFFSYELNLYDINNNYFLKIGTQRNNNIEIEINSPTNPISYSTLKQVHHHELENEMALSEPTGRFWFGENISLDNTVTIPLNINSGSSSIVLKAGVMAKSREESVFTFKVDGNNVGAIPVAAANDFNNYRYGRQGYMENQLFPKKNILSTSTLDISISYDKPQSDSEGYIDFLTLNTESVINKNKTNLIYYGRINDNYNGAQITTTDRFDYVWDITDPSLIKEINQTFNAIEVNKKKNYFSIICFDNSDFSYPEIVGKIENQDIRNINVPDLLIVTAPEYLSEAQRLASHRKSYNGISVEVVDVNKVYNEFSSGRQDITAIRDFARLLYLKNKKLKYLLLFGQGSYDYKGIKFPNESQVPIYESREVLHRTKSFSSDDYYGFFDEDEGFWGEGIDESIGNDNLDIGIGRLPSRNLEHATSMINKLISYDTISSNNSGWQKNILFVADDGDGNTHQRDANRLGVYVEETYTDFNSQRLFIDNNPKISTPSGAKSPDTNESLVNWVDNEGVLIVNYSGHGSITNWANEAILTTQMINDFTNSKQLSLFFTATCEFGRYDNPSITSGAERLLFNPNGGSVSLLTTTRPVYASSNFKINEAFYEAIFLRNSSGNYQPIGDVFRITKNNSISGVNNRNFALLGDPSMKLKIPAKDIILTKINDISISKLDTIRALDKIKITGEIRGGGIIENDFQGDIYLTLFEKQTESETRGNNGPETIFNYHERKYNLFRGVSDVENGVFEIEFVVPKDIRYAYDKSKFSFYAVENDQTDAIGSSTEIIVGGSSRNPVVDNTPPELQLDIYSENNTNIVYPDTYITATFSDESGINISGIGAGHDVRLILNDNDTSWVLNEYLMPIKGDKQEYAVVFPLKDLPEGENSLTLEAWDVLNNQSTETISFFVSKVSEIKITNLIAYPNPVENDLEIRFTHNLLSQDLIIKSNIISMNGNIVATNDFEIQQSESEILLTYDGLRSNYHLISGVYVVQIIINCPTLGIKTYQTIRIVLN